MLLKTVAWLGSMPCFCKLWNAALLGGVFFGAPGTGALLEVQVLP